MHRSGITCDSEVIDEFKKACDNSEVLYLRIEIEDEKFVKTGEGKRGDSPAENFQICKGECKPKSPCYILMKSPTEGKWLLIYWVPDDSVVKKKMLIASSFADLKTGLGNTFFIGEYPISEPDECTLEAYQNSLSEVDDESLMTWQEVEAKESAYDSTMSMSESKVSAVVGIAIPVSDDGQEALSAFQAGTINTIVFEIEPKKEVLNLGESGNFDFDDLPEKLPPKEPRYILHNFAHEKDDSSLTKEVFIYYCPDKSKPRLRMFYSTAKSTVLAKIDEMQIPEPKRFEISLSTELTSQNVLDEIYPKTTVKKVFKKPTRKGKGRSKFMGKKFEAGR